ncbi:MAG: malectin domain-containing carbohydrate-binding protein [Planctomycetota bacterium]
MSGKHRTLFAVVRDRIASPTRSTLEVLLLATLVHSAAAQDIDSRSTDWPTYMHDNSRAGGSTQTLQPPFAPADANLPWVFASGAAGLLRCSLPLIGAGEEAATYTVRLYFMSSDMEGRSPQPFAVRLQDRTVIEDLDVSAEADVAHKTLIEEFSEVRVTGALHIELVPRAQPSGTAPWPRLCAIEVLRTGASEIRKTAD